MLKFRDGDLQLPTHPLVPSCRTNNNVIQLKLYIHRRVIDLVCQSGMGGRHPKIAYPCGYIINNVMLILQSLVTGFLHRGIINIDMSQQTQNT